MSIKLTKVGDTFNTEYFVFEPDILVVNPASGYKDNASLRGWMITLASRYK